MSTKTPLTYDEITRRTVPEPDGSWRPSPEQVRQAYQGYRAMDADEQALHDRVKIAIERTNCDTSHVEIEVERDGVTLRGTVKELSTIDRLVVAAHSADGVGHVVDRLVVGS